MLVKITGESNKVKSNIQEALDTTHLLLGGFKDFTVRCAKTESMSRKDMVKNIINAAV